MPWWISMVEKDGKKSWKQIPSRVCTYYTTRKGSMAQQRRHSHQKKKKHGRSQTFRHWSWGVAIYFEHKPEGWTSTSTEPVFVGPFVLGRFKQSLPARRALGTGCFVLEVSQEESTCLPPQNFGNGQSLPKHVMITSSLEEKFHNKTRSQPCENVSNPCPRCA